MLQAAPEDQDHIAAILQALAARKLRAAQRASALSFLWRSHQCSLQQACEAPPFGRDCWAAWLRQMPRMLFELGGSNAESARQMIEMLQWAFADESIGGSALAQNLEAQLALTLGLVQRDGTLAPGPLLQSATDIQVRRLTLRSHRGFCDFCLNDGIYSIQARSTEQLTLACSASSNASVPHNTPAPKMC